ncbi:MAG: alpha/beta hydrolase [Saccharospirillaceae bacterium]|nr:alpha/beta hydrolase [Pseudomonadales bacterium]NRB79938.1 alpha/beta hydrolase [Saccharospirillaceae bacterium]
MKSTNKQIEHDGYHVFYKRIEYSSFEANKIVNKKPKAVLLLHGAGVAGELTWLTISKQLKQFDLCIIPDLRGMGKSFPIDKQEQAFSIKQMVADVAKVLEVENIEYTDVVGYSLGGLITMELKSQFANKIGKLVLVEPALLEREDLVLSKKIRASYSIAAKKMRDPETMTQGVRFFIEAVSPVRNRPKAAQLSMEKRLSARAIGFSYALDSVSEHMNSIDRIELLDEITQTDTITSLIGERSRNTMHEFHTQLQLKYKNWSYISVQGCDHSLPYQKPRKIAELIDQALKQ